VADCSVARICREHCKSGEVAVDVGANIGLFSAMLSRMGFTPVLAFEPAPTNYKDCFGMSPRLPGVMRASRYFALR
jgi:hypothetical protein